VTACEAFSTGSYHKYWHSSVVALLKLLEIPPAPTSGDGYDQSTEADLDDVSFSVSFANLNTAKKAPVDFFPEIVDTRKYVGTEVQKTLTGAQGSNFRTYLGELTGEEKSVLESYA